MRSQLVRFPSEIDSRLDVLLELMSANRELRGTRLSRTAVLREAILEGLDVLEDRYGIGQKRK